MFASSHIGRVQNDKHDIAIKLFDGFGRYGRFAPETRCQQRGNLVGYLIGYLGFKPVTSFAETLVSTTQPQLNINNVIKITIEIY